MRERALMTLSRRLSLAPLVPKAPKLGAPARLPSPVPKLGAPPRPASGAAIQPNPPTLRAPKLGAPMTHLQRTAS